MSLHKVTKNRGSFPSDEAVLKLFYLALMNISQKWTMPLQNWKAALNRFTIMFKERMTSVKPYTVYTKFGIPPQIRATVRSDLNYYKLPGQGHVFIL